LPRDGSAAAAKATASRANRGSQELRESGFAGSSAATIGRALSLAAIERLYAEQMSSLPPCNNSGCFLIAVSDADSVVPETAETNNNRVQGMKIN
jgi:hypothetical protein